MSWLWPQVDDELSAKHAAHFGMGSCFFTSVITGVVTYLSQNAIIKLPFQMGPDAYLDCAIFFVFGIGIFYMSRIAALGAFLLFAFEKYMMLQEGMTTGSAAVFVFLVYYFHGVRGTFAFHRIRKQRKVADALREHCQPNPLTGMLPTGVSLPPVSAQKEKTAKMKFAIPLPVMILLVIVVGGVGYTFLPGMMASEEVVWTQEAATTKDAPVDSDQTVFHLKEGSAVRGTILLEDDVYYKVDIGGGQEKIVIKQDIQSIS